MENKSLVSPHKINQYIKINNNIGIMSSHQLVCLKSSLKHKNKDNIPNQNTQTILELL